jgi:Fic family protein
MPNHIVVVIFLYSVGRCFERQRSKSTAVASDLKWIRKREWAKITKRSQNTPLRDIQNLIEKGILAKENGGGRNTAYTLRE